MADIEKVPRQTETPNEKAANELHESNNAFLVTFGSEDPEKPKNWPKKTKWGVTVALSATGFNRIMLSTIMAPAINTISIDFNMTNIESVMSLSIYILATAFGPLIIGPLSEIYGRKRIVHTTNIWFLIWNIICGFANSTGLLIASRLLAGFGASAVYAVGVGVVGDVWSQEQRGRSLSLYLLWPLLGAAIGPILGGFITQYTSWRWVFWSTSILQAILAIASIPFIRESYAPLLLRRKAERLRKETADPRYYAEIETREEGRSSLWKVQNSLSRPFRLLVFHPIIQIQAILSGLSYGLLYLALSSFSTLFVSAYSESISISGLHYIALTLGEVLGTQLCGPLIDYTYRKLKARAGGNASPELRLPLSIPGAIMTPIGLLIYGWATQYHLFWFVVDIGAFILTLGMTFFGTPLSAYVMDSYPEHVSSATAAVQVFRSLTAFAFPLFAPSMYKALGYGWGNTLMAFLSFGIALPAIGVLWRYGAKLRASGGSSY